MSLTRALRKHMKKMLVVLVVLIAIAFGVTGTMTEIFRRMLSSSWARMFGREVTQDEFQATRRRILSWRMLLGGSRDDRIKDKEVWEYMAMVEEAKRSGVIVTDRELREQILRTYKQIRLYQADTPEERWRKQMEFSRLTSRQIQERLDAIPFDEVDYNILIKNRFDMTVSEFEYMYRELLLINTLLTYVKGSALASTESIYEKFLEDYHQRRIDYLHLDSEDYVDRIEIKEDDLLAYYEDNKFKYEVPERISFEYIFARYDDVKASLAEPTEDALKEFYERQKKLYWEKPAEETGEEGVGTPEEQYKPYEDVKGEVKFYYEREQSEKKAEELVTKATEKINSIPDIELLKIAEIGAETGLLVGETKPFAIGEAGRLTDKFGNCPQFERMFDPEGLGQVGGKFLGPHDCTKGKFFYRISTHEPKYTKPIEEVREEIESGYRNMKAAENAKKDAERVLEEARKLKGFNNDLIVKEKLVKITTDYFKSSANKGDIKTLDIDDKQVIDKAFEIKELKDFAEPLKINVAGKDQYYLIQYKARMDPSSSEFLTKRQTLISDKTDESGEEIIKEWKKDLLQRANIEKLYLGGEEEQEPEEEDKTENEKEEQPEDKKEGSASSKDAPSEEQPVKSTPDSKDGVKKTGDEKAPEEQPEGK